MKVEEGLPCKPDGESAPRGRRRPCVRNPADTGPRTRTAVGHGYSNADVMGDHGKGKSGGQTPSWGELEKEWRWHVETGSRDGFFQTFTNELIIIAVAGGERGVKISGFSFLLMGHIYLAKENDPVERGLTVTRPESVGPCLT